MNFEVEKGRVSTTLVCWPPRIVVVVHSTYYVLQHDELSLCILPCCLPLDRPSLNRD